MIRRILFLGVVVYAAVLIAKANTKRATDQSQEQNAEANWDSEGGAPAPDLLDTPAMV